MPVVRQQATVNLKRMPCKQCCLGYRRKRLSSLMKIFLHKRIDAYRWDLWGVAYLINGGCSDDSFEYFRCWLIGQGEAAYKQVLAEPQSILSFLEGDEEEVECEALMYASSRAYESLVGEAMSPLKKEYSGAAHPAEPAGEPWEEEDLESRFPKVAERYS